MDQSQIAAAPETTTLKLTAEEMVSVQRLHQEAQQITVQIGQAEIRKMRLLSSLGEVEERGLKIMNEIGARLGLAPNTRWQAAPDGSVIVDSPTQK